MHLVLLKNTELILLHTSRKMSLNVGDAPRDLYKAFLLPIWEHPLGLTMTPAMTVVKSCLNLLN